MSKEFAVATKLSAESKVPKYFVEVVDHSLRLRCWNTLLNMFLEPDHFCLRTNHIYLIYYLVCVYEV